MKFSFTEDQRLLATAVREALAKSCPPETVRAAKTDPAVRRGDAWRALAELGLLGAHVPEEHGGLGLTPLDTVLAYEEIGRAAVPGPIVETAVAAPLLVGSLLGGPDWLERIATGAAAVSVCTTPSPYLLDADLADLLAVRRGGGLVLAGPDTAELIEQPSADPTRRLFSLAGGEGVMGTAGAAGERIDRRDLDRAFDHAALATAAQLLGLGRHLLDAAVAYAGQRKQFGRQIGSFQAVKHQLADVAIALGFAAPAVHRAAYTLTHAGTPTHAQAHTRAETRPVPSSVTASRDVSAAKVAAAAAAQRAVRTALQVHGGIGYTDELDLHLWFARVWSLRVTWGDDRWHRDRLNAALLGEPAVTRVP